MHGLTVLTEVGVSGLLDIAFMALLMYAVLVWFKQTRAAFVLTGIIIVGAVYLLARQFNLVMTTSILQGFFAVILVAVIVIFQEELRRFFEQVAVWSLNPSLRRRPMRVPRKEAEMLVRTLTDLARERIGALVVLRGKDPIVRHLDGGVELHGEMSEPLLKSLFDPHSIGHDGAVVIERGRVTSFGCHLPLSKDFQKLQHQGTRHAAALGLAERCDALCLVVSEERGEISAARHGEIHPAANPQALSVLLEQFYQEVTPRRMRRRWQDFFSKNSREKLLAVAMSAALWFVLVHESKSAQRTFTVPVEYANLPPELTVAELHPRTIEVTFSGSRRNLYFTDARQIQLVLKLYGVEEGTRTLTVSASSLSYPPGITPEYIEPREVTVRVQPLTPASSRVGGDATGAPSARAGRR